MPARRFASNIAALYSAASGGGGNIDLLTLSPLLLMDMKRGTTAVNADGSGGTPATGSGALYASDRSGNARPLAHGGIGNAPVLRSDATLSQSYLEFTAASSQLLASPAFTKADPFVIIAIFRQRAWATGKYLCSARSNYEAAILQSGSSPQLGVYDGGATAVALQSGSTLSAWHCHVAQFNGDATTSFQVDNNTAATGDAGASGIVGGINLGCGPDSAGTSSNTDIDVGLFGIFPALTSGQIAQAKTSAGADWGLVL